MSDLVIENGVLLSPVNDPVNPSPASGATCDRQSSAFLKDPTHSSPDLPLTTLQKDYELWTALWYTAIHRHCSSGSHTLDNIHHCLAQQGFKKDALSVFSYCIQLPNPHG